MNRIPLWRDVSRTPPIKSNHKLNAPILKRDKYSPPPNTMSFRILIQKLFHPKIVFVFMRTYSPRLCPLLSFAYDFGNQPV